MFGRHCSDETLLAHVDGELSLHRVGRVKKHLQSCWRCRARMAELEDQARTLATAFNEQVFPGSWRNARARDEFWARVERYERSLAPAPQFRTMVHAAACSRWAAAVCVLLVAGVALIHRLEPAPPTASSVLAATRVAEERLQPSTLPVHQDFRVEIQQSRPGRTGRKGRLQVWASGSDGRFASRWSDAAGSLRYAAWRTADNQEHVFAGLSKRPAVVIRNLASLAAYGIEPEQLEAGFLRWLESNRWKPVSLTSDFRMFLSEDGVEAGVRRERNPDGKGVFRVWARQNRNGLRIEWIVDVELETFRPRLQAIRFETSDRAVELRIVPERIETLAPEQLHATLFKPEAGLNVVRTRREKSSVRTTAPPPVLPAPFIAPEPEEPGPSPQDLEDAEMEVRFALHRVRACLGEPVAVERGEDGRILVTGLTRTASRKSQLTSSLAALKAGAIIAVEIQTTEEALAAESAAPMGRAAPEATHVGPQTLPIQEELEKYFTGRERSGHRITELANQAVTMSTVLMDEAWALRRLAERYGEQPQEALRPEARRLLEVMIRDHSTALRNQTGTSRALLEPILAFVAKGHVRLPFDSQLETSEGEALWNHIFSLFALANRTAVLLEGLFAGGGLPVEPDPSDPGRMRILTGEEAAARLLGTYGELAAQCRGFDARTTFGFLSRPETRAGK